MQRLRRGPLPEPRLVELRGAPALEGTRAGQALVEHAADRVEIGAGVEDPSVKPLGSHVVQGASASTTRRAAGLQPGPGLAPAEAEVDQDRGAVRSDEHVRWRQIAVQETLSMEVGKRVAEPAEKPEARP